MPLSVINAAVSILAIGKNTNIVTIETTPKIELTTNTSPFIAPLAAIPWVKINKKDDATINAP